MLTNSFTYVYSPVVVVPVAVYNDEEEVNQYIMKMPYGQQAAVFTQSKDTLAAYIDLLSTSESQWKLL